MEKPLTVEEQVIAALRRITRAIDLNSRLLLQKHGLTTPQLAALQTIWRLQPVSVGGLAREIHLSPATVTGITSRLEKRGLVVRTRGDSDRRSVVMLLTNRGTELVRSAPSLLQERFRNELSKLQQWEQTLILSTLQRIASMMDAERIEAALVLAPEVSAAPEEDVTGYLDKAVVPGEGAPLAADPPLASESIRWNDRAPDLSAQAASEGEAGELSTAAE